MRVDELDTDEVPLGRRGASHSNGPPFSVDHEVEDLPDVGSHVAWERQQRSAHRDVVDDDRNQRLDGPAEASVLFECNFGRFSDLSSIAEPLVRNVSTVDGHGVLSAKAWSFETPRTSES